MTISIAELFVILHRQDHKLENRPRELAAGYHFVTTDHVLDEVITWLRASRKLPIQKVMPFILEIIASDVEIIALDEKEFAESINILSKYKDHYFSFTDCASFVVMKQMKIKEAITTDKHFHVAGFKNLLTV